MKLKLREGCNLERGRWAEYNVKCNRLGLRVVYDTIGNFIKLYNNEFLYALDAKPDNWESVAHAYFVKRKIESPWEKAC